jgi:hypothetical protein
MVDTPLVCVPLPEPPPELPVLPELLPVLVPFPFPVLPVLPVELLPEAPLPAGALEDRYDLEIYPLPEPVETIYQLSVSPMTVTALPAPSVASTPEPVPGFARTFTPSVVYSVEALE